MITVEQYFHNPRTGQEKPHTGEQTAAAFQLLERVNALLDEYHSDTENPEAICQPTGCEISGVAGGAGDGGFRAPDSTTGAPKSSHREARAVDVYDPGNRVDKWLDIFEGPNGANEKLAQYELYREHPDATQGWCHLSTKAPGSGRRTFRP